MPYELTNLDPNDPHDGVNAVSRAAGRVFLARKSADPDGTIELCGTRYPVAQVIADVEMIYGDDPAAPETHHLTKEQGDTMNAGDVFLSTVNSVVRKADRPLTVGEIGEIGMATARANAKPGELWYRTPPGCGYQALTSHVFKGLSPDEFAERMSSPGYRRSLLGLCVGLGAERSSVLKAAASFPDASFGAGDSYESHRPAVHPAGDSDEDRLAPRGKDESSASYLKRYRKWSERVSAKIRAAREGA